MSASAPAAPTDLTSPDPDTPLPTYHAFPLQWHRIHADDPADHAPNQLNIHLHASRTPFPPRKPGPFILVAFGGNPANLLFVATVIRAQHLTPGVPNTVDAEHVYRLTYSNLQRNPKNTIGPHMTTNERRHWNLLTEQYPPPAFDAMYDPDEVDGEPTGRICNPLEGQVYRAAE